MNKQFITYLSNKLKTGNLRTIHLNALPGRHLTRLDLTELDLLNGVHGERVLFESNQGSTAANFLEQQLLSKAKFQLKLDFDQVPFSSLSNEESRLYEQLAKRLNALYNQNEDNYLEHGIRTFGLGYPLLVKRSSTDPEKVIKAPLLVWSLDLQRSTTAKNEWIIERAPNAPIYLNEVLLAHINAEENIQIDEQPMALPDNNLLNAEQLQQVLKRLLDTFSYELEIGTPQLLPCPDKATIEQSANTAPKVLWSGILGLYRSQKQSIIKDTDQMLARFEEMGFTDLGLRGKKRPTHSAVEADPSQEEILQTLDEREFKVIQGPPGTGKSQSLTAIITNTLGNQGKILVVCEKKTALNVIFNNLQRFGLDQLVAMIDDVNRDRKTIVHHVRQLTDSLKLRHQRFNEKTYQSKVKRYESLKEDFNLRHHNLLKQVFSDFNLQEIITDYLHYKRLATSDDILFEALDLELSEWEYDQMSRQLEQAADLFAEVDERAYVFDHLAARLFEGLRYSIKNERLMFDRIEQEKQFLLDLELEHLPPAIKPTQLAPFENNGKPNFDVSAFRKARQEVQAALYFWKTRYSLLLKVNQHIEHTSIIQPNNFFSKVKRLNLFYQKIYTHIKTLTELQEWYEQLGALVDKLPSQQDLTVLKYRSSAKAMQLFSSKHRSLHEFWKQAPAICARINRLLHKSNFQEIENELFEEEKQAVPRPEDVFYMTEQLDACLANKGFFKEYFEWRTFFEAAKPLFQTCLVLLRKTATPEHWEAVFKYNYLYLLIDQESARLEHFNTNDKTLDKLTQLEAELRRLHLRKILKTWESIRYEDIKDFNKRSNIKWLFNHRKNTKYSKKNSLRHILHEEFDLFTNIFPVVLVNPVVASAILPLQANLFDVVLFDEASQLRLEDTYPSLIRGRIKVISGDKQQMPPSNYFGTEQASDMKEIDWEANLTASTNDRTNPLYLAESESLLEFGNNLNPNAVHTSHLDFHYRSQHPDLINFSNAAFYGSRLVALPEIKDYQALRFFHLKGTYTSNGTNPVEAERILSFLKEEYPPREDGSYPSLGIATFNMQQRNLIKDKIHEASILDPLFRQKMNQIGAVDKWFVKNLENVQGDERDIIILSTTFGPNAAGEFRQNFGLLNGARGYRLLNVIITRAKQQLCIFSSIPSEYFSQYTSDILEYGNRGKAILYAYLDYAQAIEQQNQEAKAIILDLLKDACEEEGNTLHHQNLDRPFSQELYHYLIDHIHEDCILPNYQLGDYQLDFVILDEQGKPKVVIDCDGAPWHESPQAYSYDLHRQRIFETQGLNVFHVWTKAWWPEPTKELDKFTEFLQIHCPSALIG